MQVGSPWLAGCFETSVLLNGKQVGTLIDTECGRTLVQSAKAVDHRGATSEVHPWGCVELLH